MNQVTWLRAEEIADRAVDKTMGFDPIDDAKSYPLTGRNLRRLLRDAAVIALREAGCLADQDRRDKAATNRAADAAERRHNAWKKATGNKF